MAREQFWSRISGSRVSRRGALASAGAAASAAFLAACGGSGNDNKGVGTSPQTSAGTTTGSGTAAAAGTPKKGGNLVLNVGNPGSQPLDPHITLNAAFFYWGLLSNLMAYSDPQKLEPIRPGLVEKWEQPDKSTIVLHTRQGVKFHANKVTNGRAMTAKDI